ncbi:retrovirus-related pol polyprotein from transposon TNT 1-94 [Tanacetum coccineum]
MWTDLVLAHEEPFDTRDTKIAALRLKFNAFKALEGEKVNGIFIRLKCLLNDLENNGVSIPQAEDSDSDVEEETRSSSGFLADLNAEFHDRALLANQKRYYKRSGRVVSTKKPIDKSNETCFACGKLRKYKGLKAEIDILTKKIDAMPKGVTKVKAFMTIAEDEPSVGKSNARLGQWVEIAMKKYVEDQRKNLLSKFNSLNQELSSCMFTKVDESPSETALEITSDIKSECDIQEPLPPLPKLSGAEPIITSADVINFADLTQTLAISKEIKKVPNKRSAVKDPKKKAQTMSPSVPDPIPIWKADSSIEQLLFTLMEKVKGLKKQIKTPSNNSASVSQIGTDCIMSFIKKMENLNEVRVKELRSDNGTEFRNHKLEEFCDEKDISQNSPLLVPLKKMV